MFTRATRLIIAITGLALGLSLLAGVQRPLSQVRALPASGAYRALVERVAGGPAGAELAALEGAQNLLIQIDAAPLALMPAADRDEQARAIKAVESQLAAAVEAAGGVVLARFSRASVGLAVRLDANALPALRARPDVLGVLPIGDYATAQAPPATPTTLQQVASLIGSDLVHQLGNDGSGVDIAVVDSGVDYTHAKLGGPGSSDDYYRAYCGGALLRPADPSCNPGLPPPPDLFPNPKVRGGYDYLGDFWPEPDERCLDGDVCIYPDTNPIDGSGHGTHVADIVAGLSLSSDGADAGVAPGANLWAFKACNGAAALCEGTALLLALDHALDLDGSDRGRCRIDLGEACAIYDPADIIVLALSYPYGQPEDALTLFTDLAGYYGSLVVAAAGNDGAVPYIVGTPAVAASSLAVAESSFASVPGPLVLPGGQHIQARLQEWSPNLQSSMSSPLRLGDGAGGNLNGCAALPAWSGVLLLERGGCSSGTKARNAAAAGASALLIADSRSTASPPALHGSSSTIPVFSLTHDQGRALGAMARGAAFTVGLEQVEETIVETVAATASRGPRIADSALKPDIAAPGAILSAAVGSGTELEPFAGSSGAAPVVAGVAALIVRELERRGAIDPSPGLVDPFPGAVSIAPQIKALLMNTTVGGLLTPDGAPALASLVGSGRVSAIKAVRARTLALDATDITELLNNTPGLVACTFSPYRDLIGYLFFRRTPPCAEHYPFGNDLLRTWMAQTGSISFGYQPVVEPVELQRTVAVLNFSRVARSYQISSLGALDSGVSVSAFPNELLLPGGEIGIISVTMRIDPAALAAWPEGPQALEIDGALLIDGGPNNQISLPWFVMPQRAAAPAQLRLTESQLVIANAAASQAAPAEAFALVDMSPNQCDKRSGSCVNLDYTPGVYPGSRESPPDIANVGLRGRSLPGLNSEFGLPPAPAGATPDELVEFAVTLYDKPYRATPNTPVRLEVTIDNNRDGIADFLVFNATDDNAQSVVFVRDLNPADGTVAERAYLPLDASLHTRWWVLPVPAAAVGLRSDQSFNFTVRAFDNAFGGPAWDCSPGPIASCGSHTFQTGAPALRPDVDSFTVPAAGRFTLEYSEDSTGGLGSPSQIGLLILLRDSTPEQSLIPVRIR